MNISITKQLTPKNKTVLITGASAGIGKAAAVVFAQAGYHLILTCRSSLPVLMEFSKEWQAAYGINCLSIQADMSCYEDVRKVFAQIRQLDILVNNAGISYVGLLQDMEPDDWHRIIGTNLDSCFYTCKLAIPMMLKQHSGKIINISSVWGNTGASMEVAYSASKGAVNAFTKALAKELAPSNIQVNAIACGLIDTRMNSCFTAAETAALREEIPAGRLGRADEASDLILKTAEAPDYMTGQVIAIDGGWI